MACPGVTGNFQRSDNQRSEKVSHALRNSFSEGFADGEMTLGQKLY
jgi:hypothetical protein